MNDKGEGDLRETGLTISPLNNSEHSEEDSSWEDPIPPIYEAISFDDEQNMVVDMDKLMEISVSLTIEELKDLLSDESPDEWSINFYGPTPPENREQLRTEAEDIIETLKEEILRRKVSTSKDLEDARKNLTLPVPEDLAIQLCIERLDLTDETALQEKYRYLLLDDKVRGSAVTNSLASFYHAKSPTVVLDWKAQTGYNDLIEEHVQLYVRMKGLGDRLVDTKRRIEERTRNEMEIILDIYSSVGFVNGVSRKFFENLTKRTNGFETAINKLRSEKEHLQKVREEMSERNEVYEKFKDSTLPLNFIENALLLKDLEIYKKEYGDTGLVRERGEYFPYIQIIDPESEVELLRYYTTGQENEMVRANVIVMGDINRLIKIAGDSDLNTLKSILEDSLIEEESELEEVGSTA